ncbi:MAG: hypothetical protein D8M57_05155 [Candidatus Scalindua sp. AMX11]|nr:MAG: hypothetical protein DWQ00_07630 [Candidatus Scalindua sp.]NOG85996.1 hypothetical protein [Planctomycetota bacterium]RZV91374.1 MAG: hypothetical protein EX341_05435 [Candidatus Scalindua sp. SCAELEC01]TDE65930.1 MAG: hypothetical protein D8M57_05155 [Candidatus Scalindua sp. AMX11]GJQ59236.1 MAG: hypothetical protein SCALA701_20370 [Candidatus Scalindua sp.]
MKYTDIVYKLNHIQDDGYFNNHYSKETHGTGSFNTSPFYTIGTCECASCIAHALAFGMHGHYGEKMITQEIIEELKSIYGIEDLLDAVREEKKEIIRPMIETISKSKLDSGTES